MNKVKKDIKKENGANSHSWRQKKEKVGGATC